MNSSMATISSQGGSFNILGSFKLNTIDGKNPTTKKPASAASSTAQQAKAKDEGSLRESEADRLTALSQLFLHYLPSVLSYSFVFSLPS